MGTGGNFLPGGGHGVSIDRGGLNFVEIPVGDGASAGAQLSSVAGGPGGQEGMVAAGPGPRRRDQPTLTRGSSRRSVFSQATAAARRFSLASSTAVARAARMAFTCCSSAARVSSRSSRVPSGAGPDDNALLLPGQAHGGSGQAIRAGDDRDITGAALHDPPGDVQPGPAAFEFIQNRLALFYTITHAAHRGPLQHLQGISIERAFDFRGGDGGGIQGGDGFLAWCAPWLVAGRNLAGKLNS